MDRPHKRDMERNKGAYKVDFPKTFSLLEHRLGPAVLNLWLPSLSIAATIVQQREGKRQATTWKIIC